MSVPLKRCGFGFDPTWIIFPVCRSATRPKGTRSYSSDSRQLNSPIVFGWLLWNYLCWESATGLWVSLNWCLNKLWEVKRGDGQSPARSPGVRAGPFDALSSRPFSSSRFAWGLSNASGLRRKDGGWKGNCFLCRCSMLMTQTGEVCKVGSKGKKRLGEYETESWAKIFSGSYISLKCASPSYEHNVL